MAREMRLERVLLGAGLVCGGAAPGHDPSELYLGRARAGTSYKLALFDLRITTSRS